MTDRGILFWLPPKPADFAARLTAAQASDGPLAPALKALANHALDINGLNRLAKALRKARGEGRSLRPLTPFRLGVLSNSTTALIAPALEATALRYGLALEVVEAPFGQIVQEALDPEGLLATSELDAVLIAVDVYGAPLRETPGDADAAEATLAGALGQFDLVRDGLRANTRATLIWQTLPRLPETLFGSYDFRLPGTSRWLVDQLNRRLADSLPGDELLVDIAGLAETLGLDRWHDPVLRNIGKLPFAQEFAPVYAEHVARVIGALRGKSRKALVLDLDNTVWGGIIGDDGLEGIVIGQGSALGEAHLSVQQGALDLHGRGVVLAVSSKNEDETARTPFRQHADMLLKEDHIAVFQANWIDKATNLATIADALTLGRDALVFLDDNPAERMQVRSEHPEIAVPELPADAAFYARALNAGGYFEAVAFSDDDRNRSGFYKENARRLQLQGSAGSLDAYHASLEMVATFQPFDAVGRARISQLINKSNQFNLTTRRYTEAQVGEMEADAGRFTLQARLADVFGDNGMISVVVADRGADAWEIDTWLMSCRVLGRRMEEAVLAELVRAAKAAGAKALVGRFIPSDKNMMVAKHYEKLGFEKIAETDEGETVWRLALEGVADRTLPMQIVRPAAVGA
ncbi:HAD-IIIC family phosphatase [Brevundimonas lenta]|uniref:FkbH-like protein n=1 Tax=Brevundimonas lenta TaxID=424796 RepID=A0A7W6JFD7_9CAUL|nr:HAD-IIIC family phosphatase [Brevundimonas lenta]MBB4084128.1 FkbH-like protein [Brevundimonas lenta]